MSEINAEQWQKVEALFSAALDCAPAAREEFLQQQCCDEPELLEMVRSLFAVNDEAADFIAHPAISIVFGAATPSRLPGPARLPSPFQQLLCLGAGSNGIAYKALDQRDNNIVTVKKLSRLTGNLRDSFCARFETLTSCQHANLASPKELFDDNEGLYYTRIFVPGIDIKSAAVNYSLKEISAIFKQAVLALDQLHKAGIVHENLKPANMFVNSDGMLMITDYGFMPDCPEINQPDNSDQIVKYLAPEQCQGRAVTPASDWYSLGVILYEILTGNAPFVGSVTEISLAKRRFRPPAPKTISAAIPNELDQLCQSLLHRDAKARPHSKDILASLCWS